MQTQLLYLPTNREDQEFWAAASGPVTVTTYDDLTASDINSSPGDSRTTPTRRTSPTRRHHSPAHRRPKVAGLAMIVETYVP